MDLLKRILIKVCSLPAYQWGVRKIGMRMWLKAQKAPEVQERMKAVRAAAPHSQERFYAHLDYMLACGNEIGKSKWVKYDQPPIALAQMVGVQARLHKVEKGNATASEIEEFRHLAGEILRNWQPHYPPDLRQRIGAALKLV